MNFTATPPTELGAYWWKETEHNLPRVVTIEQTPYIQGLAAVLGDEVYEIDNFPKGLWSEPLVPKTPDCRWTKTDRIGYMKVGCFDHITSQQIYSFCPLCGGRIITP